VSSPARPGLAGVLANPLRLGLFGAAGAALASCMALSAFAPDPRTQSLDQWAKIAKASPTELTAIGAIGFKAASENPIDGQSVGLVGAAADLSGNTARAGKLMVAANNLNRRVDVADLWLFQANVQAQHPDKAFDHVDAYMRRHPNTVPVDLLKMVIYATALPGGAQAGRAVA
jgi:hypothetical protein